MDNENFTVDFGEVTNVGGGGTSDFNELTNRPKYDSNTMSGDTNIPKVPSKTSDLTNDSDYQTETEVSDAISTAIGAISIPTKTSDLTNDGADGQSTYVETDELAAVATSGSYADLENKPSIPTVNDATLTITQNGISKGTFTANDADDTTIEVPDTTYSNFTGTDGTAAGAAGLVPAPATTDAGKFLKADGTWDTAGGMPQYGDIINIGSSNTVDSSNNVGVVIGKNAQLQSSSDQSIRIGTNGLCYGPYSIAIGYNAQSAAGNSGSMNGSIAIGRNAVSRSNAEIAIGTESGAPSGSLLGAVSLGAYSSATRTGEVNIGSSNASYGFNSTNYRVIGGVHDGQLANDAVTVGQINALIDAINTAANTNISHIGS